MPKWLPLKDVAKITHELPVMRAVKLGPIDVFPILFVGMINVLVSGDALKDYPVNRRMNNTDKAIRIVLDDNHGFQVNGYEFCSTTV